VNRRASLRLLAALVLTAPALALAQASFPSKPLRLVVPFPPGGPTDVFARQYAARLGTVLGQPVVVENKSGASGAIGSVEVMRSAPDGYTLLFGTASTHALYNLMSAKPQYDSIKDFAHVAIVGGAPIVLVVAPSMPATLKGVVDMARASPGKLRYGSPGEGTMMHLATERVKREAGDVDIQHIPFRGSAPAKTALLGGQIEIMVDTLGPALPSHKAGQTRIVAIAAAARSPLAPEVPTVDEALGTKGFEAILWNVVAAPAGTPAPVLNTLAEATRKVMGDASLQAELAKMAIAPTSDSNPAAAVAHIRTEMQKWKPVIDATGIKSE
jgi:tripartite-type tricarboxylate transporter receptor subunit TctC